MFNTKYIFVSPLSLDSLRVYIGTEFIQKPKLLLKTKPIISHAPACISSNFGKISERQY
jgi:hypothetical protein